MMTDKMRQRLRLFVSLSLLGTTCAALPLQMAVTYRQKECLYETLAAEYVKMAPIVASFLFPQPRTESFSNPFCM